MLFWLTIIIIIINVQEYLHIITSHIHKIHDSWPLQNFIHLF